MRLIVFFDLPSVTTSDLRQYRKFRKYLIKNGFIMMQESIYSRLIINNSSASLVKKDLLQNLPKTGLVQLMSVTEKQYSNIEYLVGKSKSSVINSTDRVVKI